MNNPNRSISEMPGNKDNRTGWESVATMANKYPKQSESVDPAKFEKPSEDFDTIAPAVVKYTHCDLGKKNSFYQVVMTSVTIMTGTKTSRLFSLLYQIKKSAQTI